MRNLSQHDQELSRAVSEVLHYLWDPIQIAGIPQARDEYDGYVSHVVSMLKQDITEADISKYLQSIAVDRMGLDCSPKLADDAASALDDWRELLRERHT